MAKASDSSVVCDTVNTVLPAFPFLVVMTMAPLDAFSPYRAAAAAPVKTDMLSISSGLMSAIPSEVPRESNSFPPSPPALSIGIPSITYNTLLDCEIERIPRITTLEAPPTPDEDALMLTPATLPFNELIKFASLLVSKSSPFTCCTL